MVKPVYTEIIINASPDKIYKILTDLSNWKEWNPFITNAEGKTEIGSSLKLTFNNGMNIYPKVTQKIENKEFKWLGHLGINHIFDGEHQFILEDLGDNRTKFIQKEDFSGILAILLFDLLIRNQTKANFIKLNEAIKKKVEN